MAKELRQKLGSMAYDGLIQSKQKLLQHNGILTAKQHANIL